MEQETAGLTRDEITELEGITCSCNAARIPSERLGKESFTTLAISFDNVVSTDCPPSDLDVVVVEEIELLEEAPEETVVGVQSTAGKLLLVW